MKLKNLLPTLVLSLAVAPELAATPVSGNQLEIDPTGTGDQVAGSIVGGVIGSGNQILGTPTRDVLVVGSSNVAHSYDDDLEHSLVVGSSNRLSGGSSNVLFGSGHEALNSSRALVAGSNNLLDDWWGFGNDDPDRTSSNVFVFGANHYVGGRVSYSIVSGYNNYVDPPPYGGYPYDDPYYEVQSSATLGRGLINQWNNAILVGRYNDSTIAPDSGLIFAVGVGDGGSDGDHDRVNAVEVYSDASVSLGKVDADGLNPGAYPFSVDAEGKITMYPQGDISMGAFQ